MKKGFINALLLVALPICVQAAQPSFVFILVDDMGWTGTSVGIDSTVPESKSDFYQTPNLEKLAGRGMCFSQAYAPAALCTPSRAAILTGKTPAELHMTTPGGGRPQSYQKLAAPRHLTEFPESETTIGEALKEQGYATAHFGKWHLGNQSPGLHGFDVHDGATGNDENGTAADPKEIFSLTERAIDFMTEQSKAGRPFYLQISHYAVHAPIQSTATSQEKFTEAQKGTRHSDIEYAAMTWDLDVSIGTMLAKIDHLKLDENTYIVVMSDNGAPGNPRSSQNLPLNGGKGTFYEGGIRVPLVIAGPGIKSQTACGEAVSGCDLFSTFCELANAKAGNAEGVSLVPLLTGKPDEFERTKNAMLFHYPHYGQGPRQKPQTALVCSQWKLIKEWEAGSYQLFDLSKDLEEKNDLSKSNPDKLEEMVTQMEQRLKESNAQLPTQNSGYDPDEEPQRKRGRNR